MKFGKFKPGDLVIPDPAYDCSQYLAHQGFILGEVVREANQGRHEQCYEVHLLQCRNSFKWLTADDNTTYIIFADRIKLFSQ